MRTSSQLRSGSSCAFPAPISRVALLPKSSNYLQTNCSNHKSRSSLTSLTMQLCHRVKSRKNSGSAIDKRNTISRSWLSCTSILAIGSTILCIPSTVSRISSMNGAIKKIMSRLSSYMNWRIICARKMMSPAGTKTPSESCSRTPP